MRDRLLVSLGIVAVAAALIAAIAWPASHPSTSSSTATTSSTSIYLRNADPGSDNSNLIDDVAFGVLSAVHDYRTALIAAGCLFLPAGWLALGLPDLDDRDGS